MRRRQWLPILATALVAGACGPTLEPPEFLSNFRIITVTAEPPEIAPGEVSQVTLHTFDPLARAETFRWYICRQRSISGSGTSPDCLDDREAGGLKPWLLPAGTTRTVAVTMPRVATQRLALPDLGLPPEIADKIDVQLPVDLEGPDSSGGFYLPLSVRGSVSGPGGDDTRQAIYQLRYSLAVQGLPPGTSFSPPRNRNPELTALYVVPLEEAAKPVTVDEQGRGIDEAMAPALCAPGDAPDGGVPPDAGTGPGPGRDGGAPDGGRGDGGAPADAGVRDAAVPPDFAPPLDANRAASVLVPAAGSFEPILLDEAGAVVIPRDRPVALRAVYGCGSEETYLGLAGGAARAETLSTHWFATAGKFANGTSSPRSFTGATPPRGLRPADIEFDPKPHLDGKSGDVPVDLFVVANDGRGGNAVIHRRFVIRLP